MLKRLYILIGFVLLFSFGSIEACSPLPMWEFTIEIIDCDEVPDYYHVDILVNKDSIRADATISEEYKLAYPNYQDYTFLDDGEWVSYRAFIELSEEYRWECIIHVEGMSADQFQIILFDDRDGTVLFQSDTVTEDQVAYDSENHDFVYWGYSLTDDELSIRHVSDGCYDWSVTQGYLMIASFIIVVLFVVLVNDLALYFLLRKFDIRDKKIYVLAMSFVYLILGGLLVYLSLNLSNQLSPLSITVGVSIIIPLTLWFIHEQRYDNLTLEQIAIIYAISMVIPVLIFILTI